MLPGDLNSPCCHLCGKRSPLQNSHIFPKFVVDWFKETGTGYLRKATSVNRRAQDGSKERLLCVQCEQRFSVGESYFAKQVFYPVLSGAGKIAYDSRLTYFLISVLWRVAHINLPKLRVKGNRFLSIMEAATEEWRRFLVGDGLLQSFGHIHLFVFDIAQNPPPMAKGFNVYCARALDGTFFNSEESCYVYAKFARFLSIAILTPYRDQDWVNTRIVNGESTLLNSPQELRDGFVGNFIVHRARTIAQILDLQMTARQRGVVEAHVFNNADRIANSDLVRAALADYESQEDFTASLPKIGRNEKCPCGSGDKFKNCHGKP